jgi:ribosome maturation factor RimP
MASTRERERQLTREITPRVEHALPGTEVLAVELNSPDRFTVYVDHARGVDHALCERVTDVLRDYLREYAIDVSSPGFERPVRTAAHFRNAVGRRVALRTADRRFRGEVVAAGETAVKIGVDGSEFDIPYDSIVRGNLIDEG